MKSKLALVLSGGFVKGVAHISIAEEMYARGYVPDVFVGSSIGAVFAVLLGYYDDPKIVKELSLGFIKDHVWPELLSFDVFSKAGLFESKQVIRLIAKYAGLEGKTFKDLKKSVDITATDLNTGELIIFGQGQGASSKGQAMTLSEALEASISFPVIFKPKKLRINGKTMALADGGIRENCPISVAAKIPGVKKIIACDLGYCGQLKGDFNKKNTLEVFMQCLELTTSFSQINRYMNDDVFIRNKIAVRIINPGIFDAGPFEFKKIPSMIAASAKTARLVLSRFGSPDDFFKRWKKNPFKGSVKASHLGSSKANSYELINLPK